MKLNIKMKLIKNIIELIKKIEIIIDNIIFPAFQKFNIISENIIQYYNNNNISSNKMIEKLET